VVFGAAWTNVSGDLIPPAASLTVLAIPVVGGLGSVSGAIAAAVLLYAPIYCLAPSLAGVFGEDAGFQLLFAGAGLVLVPLLYPAGIAGAVAGWWDRFVKRLDESVATWEPDEARPPLAIDHV